MRNKNCLLAKALVCFMLFALISGASYAQKRVTGKVVGPTNQPIAGASVIVDGTSVGGVTLDDGTFSINVPAGKNKIIISSVGFKRKEITVGSQSSFNVSLEEDVSGLNEIVVTGYTAQRKKDIIGAVSVVDAKDLQQTPAANLAAQLQGRAAGVVVSSAGEPGAAAVVRIRGFASAGNNDPLYIIDGVPTDDPSKINPGDVESLQVLKDASSAAIYGSRASNGVIIITTKQGKAGRASVSYDNYVGTQIVTDRMMPDMLNTAQYLDYLQKTTGPTYRHPVFGLNGSFTVPDYIVVSSAFKGGVSASDPRAKPDNYSIGSNFNQILKTSAGTDWFKELTQNSIITNHQLTASGGLEKAVYSLGANYYDQKGTFINTFFKRYSVRANSMFKPTSFLQLGENLQVSYEERLGGANRGEGDAWASGYRMVPYIPVYDIKGGFGGNGVGESGNGSNPVANLERGKNNTNKYTRLFGNVYAVVPFTSYLTARSSFGVDMGNQFNKNISIKTYERSENQGTTQLNESAFYYATWTWTNTLSFSKVFAENHDVKLLVGSEAVKGNSRGLNAFGQNFDFDTPDFISLDRAVAGSLSDRGINNFGVGRSSLFSYFGRVDYTYKERYLFNGTFRRDGNSRFGPNVRYANFPSFGVGWRVSEESFMKGVTWIRDLKLRGGWGQLGSQSNVPANNQYSTYTSTAGRTNYDISGNNSSSSQGYRPQQEGNPNTKWETSETTNFGLDATLFGGKLDFSLDVYKKDTKDLLVPQVRNGLEPIVDKPLINIGTMRNTGFDLSVNHKGQFNRDFTYDVGVTFSHYKNTMTKFNDEGSSRIINLERLSNAVKTEKGQPISSFHGFVIDGFYSTAAEIAALPMTGAVIGSWRYKDINGDKQITDADRTYIGNPHPDFQMGTSIDLAYKAFTFSAFLFWNQGNEIYNYTKYYTDMRVFVGGVSTRVLTDSWTPTNQNAKLPLLAPGAANGYTSFTTSTSNSYYVEDGSYLRAKTMQLAYTLPKSVVDRMKIQNIRVYVQAQNLFTITNYTGSDPDLNIISRDPGGARDLYIGVDLGGFPNPKQFLVGLNVTF